MHSSDHIPLCLHRSSYKFGAVCDEVVDMRCANVWRISWIKYGLSAASHALWMVTHLICIGSWHIYWIIFVVGVRFDWAGGENRSTIIFRAINKCESCPEKGNKVIFLTRWKFTSVRDGKEFPHLFGERNTDYSILVSTTKCTFGSNKNVPNYLLTFQRIFLRKNSRRDWIKLFVQRNSLVFVFE